MGACRPPSPALRRLVGHHLNVLEDCGLLRREPDVFRSGRSRYRVAEPLITFYQVVMRPQWGLLESGRARPVWQDATVRFSAQVLGPHFEQLCREFARAAPGEPRRILSRGAAKRGEVLGARHVDRLRRARDLLAGRGYDTRDTVLACYGGAGFDPHVSVAADRVLTVGPEDLYAEIGPE
ncbi:MAG: hypothetical protein ACRDTC_02275 [Pseudonocardiaceae bacterium]